MSDRREFIKQASLITIGGVLLPELLTAKQLSNIGLALYTVRDELAKDVRLTLQTVAKQGYKRVEGFYTDEFGHFFGYKPIEFKKVLSDLGLEMPSTHVLTGRAQPQLKSSMANNWENIVAQMAEYGINYIVCPWIHDDERKTIDDYKKLAQFLNEKALIASKSGIKIGYHAHDFEFFTLENQTPYDVLLGECDKSLIDFELDLYWVKKGGKNALDYFAKYPGRFTLWHVKDMDKTEKAYFTEVGNGIIDFKSIFAKEKESGMKYFYVEQDVCPSNSLDSTSISINYLKNKF
jgi:sugar phosphate isomerase/epimerase